MALTPFLQGLLGAFVCVVIVGSGYWLYQRYSEFVVIRQVVGQIIDNSNKERAKLDGPKGKSE